MTEPNDHAAERRAGAQEILDALRAGGWTHIADVMQTDLNRRYPPPEPERVWVKLSGGSRYTLVGDSLHKLTAEGNSWPAGWTVDDIKVLASLVPGLVAQPVQPTAWYAVEKDDGWALRYANLEDARRIAANIHRPPVRIIPVVELPEVPRDA